MMHLIFKIFEIWYVNGVARDLHILIKLTVMFVIHVMQLGSW
jgi:hypothetical protein